MLYHYDQLNRIMAANSLTDYTSTSGFGSRTGGNEAYDASYTYDPNGNLLTLQRYDQEANLPHDYNYEYFAGTNRLKKVTDVYTPEIPESKIYNENPLIADGKQYKHITLDGGAVLPSGYSAELEATETITIGGGAVIESGATFTATVGAPDTVVIPPEGQYLYDEIGNLVRDNGEGTTIEWMPYGKVRKVTKDNGDVMSFLYDASGNRIEKRVVSSDTIITTHYIRDASGNVMATYTNMELKEQPVYGSSRVGMYRGGAQEGVEKLGLKNYELSNHLGNVLAVITDNINIDSSEVTASVSSVSDYYPFGLSMDGRTYSSDVYRYGFNGKEKDDKGEWGQTHYDYGFRIYNPAIAKFLSVDPLSKSYPMLTPYQFAANSPISGIDQDGLEYVYYLRSPLLSKKFIKAHDAGDLYEQRRILNYATHNPFTPQSRQEIDGKVMMSSYQDGDPAGNLVYDETAPKGFTLIPYEWKEEGRIGMMSESSDIHYDFAEGKYPDKNFPTDVRENTGFYGDNDFVGNFHQASYAAGSKVDGSGIITGFLKGWGYSEFFTENISGVGLDATVYATGTISGRYLGPGLPSLKSFEGLGKSYSIGSGISTGGTWKGIGADGSTIWKGSFEGFSFGLPNLKGSGGGIDTKTKLLFPKPTEEKQP